MDSINRNQPEENKQDLRGGESVKKIKEIIETSQTCFFCTHTAHGPSSGVRPMSVQEVDEEGNIWFLSAADSFKNQEIALNPQVDLYFQGSKHSDFLHLRGQATILHDQTRIEELWTFIAKTWFTEGVTDPRISVIKVVPQEGYYWDTKHGMLVAGARMLVGAVMGKTLDDSIEGKILPQ